MGSVESTLYERFCWIQLDYYISTISDNLWDVLKPEGLRVSTTVVEERVASASLTRMAVAVLIRISSTAIHRRILFVEV